MTQPRNPALFYELLANSLGKRDSRPKSFHLYELLFPGSGLLLRHLLRQPHSVSHAHSTRLQEFVPDAEHRSHCALPLGERSVGLQELQWFQLRVLPSGGLAHCHQGTPENDSILGRRFQCQVFSVFFFTWMHLQMILTHLVFVLGGQTLWSSPTVCLTANLWYSGAKKWGNNPNVKLFLPLTKSLVCDCRNTQICQRQLLCFPDGEESRKELEFFFFFFFFFQKPFSVFVCPQDERPQAISPRAYKPQAA